MSDAAPSRVLRLAMVGWGLGDLAMGRRAAGIAWLLSEIAALLALAGASATLTDTTWYLVPYLGGMAFVAVWTGQAVAAYRRVRSWRAGAAPMPTPAATPAHSPSRSPAAAVAWLTLPLLAWGTGFWLVAADAASPSAVIDRFVADWPSVGEEGWDRGLSERPAALTAAAEAARDRLGELCAAGRLAEDCGDAPESLLRDVRYRIVSSTDTTAVAVAEVVRFERRPARFLGLFEASELVPVPIEPILRLELAARPAALGAGRWTIVNAEAS